MKNVTLKEIAERANVSIGTVARALKNRGRISAETQKNILKIAKELGYKPNIMARALSTSKHCKILAIVPKSPSYFFDIVYRGMEDAAAELEGFKFIVNYVRPERVNEVSVMDLLGGLNKEKIDGVVLLPSPEMKETISRLAEENIPVITYNCDIDDSKRLCYIGQNTLQAGKIAGELMGRFLCGTGNVALLTGGRNVEAFSQRKKGFTRELKTHFKEIRIIENAEYFEDDVKAEKLVCEFIRKEEALKGIFATSQCGTVGAVRAMKKLGLKNRPVIVGFDTGKEVKCALEDGRLTATLSQDPYMQGYHSITFMAQVLLNQWMPERNHYYMRSRIIMRNNADEPEISISIKNLYDF